MTKKIFRSSLLTALLVLGVSLFFVFGILYQYFEEQLISQLKDKAVYIMHAVEGEGTNYIDKITDTGERVNKHWNRAAEPACAIPTPLPKK